MTRETIRETSREDMLRQLRRAVWGYLIMVVTMAVLLGLAVVTLRPAETQQSVSVAQM